MLFGIAVVLQYWAITQKPDPAASIALLNGKLKFLKSGILTNIITVYKNCLSPRGLYLLLYLFPLS